MEPFIVIGVIAIVVWSIVIHEVAHGWVAWLRGDETARMMGRLTLNPLPHIDPFMTVILPTVLAVSGAPILGGARPVPVDPRRFRNVRQSMALVAAAGPISNLLIGFALCGILALILQFGLWAPDAMGVSVLAIAAYFNVVLALFNLLPIPPLDGSKIVGSFLTGEAERFWWRMQSFGLIILLAILFVNRGLLWSVLFPPLHAIMDFYGNLFGIRYELVDAINRGFSG